MDLFSALGDLLHWLGNLLPRWQLLRSTEAGVRFGRRGNVLLKGPRIVWWLPCVQDLETVPVARQVIDLEPQTLMTSDNQTIIAGGVIVYTITDLEKYLVENYDAESSIEEVACAALRDAIVTKELGEIQKNNRKTVDNDLTRQAKDHLEEFGIEVERMRLTNFSTAKIINHVGAMPMATDFDDEE